FNGTVTESGGTIATTTSSGAITFAAAVTASSGTIETTGTGTITFNAAVTASGATIETRSSATLTFAATVTQSAGTIRLTSTGPINFNANVSQSNGTISSSSTGIITFASGYSVTQTGGTITCSTGKINFSGTFSQSTSSTATVSSTSTGIITFSGAVTQSAGTITCAKAAMNFNSSVTQSGGTISSTNTNGIITFATGQTVSQTGGTITCTTAKMYFNGTFSQTNSAGTVSVTSTGEIYFVNGFTHSGLIETTGGTLLFEAAVTTANGATIENITTKGTITFDYTYTCNGTFSSTVATTINFGSSFICASTATATFFSTSVTTFTGLNNTGPTLTPPTSGINFGNLYIGSSDNVVVAPTAAFSVAGNWKNNNTATTACLTGAYDVTFDGAAAQSIGGNLVTVFPNNIDISNGAAVTFSAPTTAGTYIVTNSININTGATATGLTLAANQKVTVDQNLTVGLNAATAKTTLTQNASTTLTIDGNATINQPNAAVTSTWTVGAGTASIDGTLTFTAPNSTANEVASITVTTGTLTVNAVSFTATNTVFSDQLISMTSTGTVNFTTLVSQTAGEISVSGAGIVNFNAGYTINGANAEFLNNAGAASFNFGGPLTCTSTRLAGMTFFSSTTSATTSTETFTATESVTSTQQITFGNFVINNGKTLTFSGNGAVTVMGNWTDNGSFVCGTGTGGVIFACKYTPAASTPQMIYLASGATETFYNLTFNLNTATNYLQVNLTNNLIQVNNSLTMTKGNVNLNGGTIQVGSSSYSATTLTWTAPYFVYGGTFARWWPAATAITTTVNEYGIFPVGSGSSDTLRECTFVSTVNPTTAGLVSVIHNDPPPLETVVSPFTTYTDNVGNVIQAASIENTTVTTDGNAGVGGTFTINCLFGGFADPTGSSESNYVLETYTSGVNGYASTVTTGAATTNGGTTEAPILQRAGLVVGTTVTNADQGIANEYVCGTTNAVATPIANLYYSIATGNWHGTAPYVWSLTSGGAAYTGALNSNATYIIQNNYTITLDENTTAAALEIQGGGSKPGGELIDNGTYTLTAGEVYTTSGSSNAYINFTHNSSIAATYNVSLQGTGNNVVGGITCTGTVVPGLIVGSSSSTTLTANTGNITVNGNLDVYGNMTMSGANTLSVTGSTTINSPAVLTTGTGTGSTFDGNLFILGGTLAVGTGTTTLTGGSTLYGNSSANTSAITGTGIFQVTSATTIDASAIMTIAPKFYINGAYTVENGGTITLSNATVDLDGTSAASSIWQQAANSTLIVEGSSVPFPTDGGIDPSANTPNIVEYNGAVNQTIASPVGTNAVCGCASYDQLVVTTPSTTAYTKSLNGNINAGTSVSITGSAILYEGTNTLKDLSADESGANLTINGNATPEAGLELVRSASGTYPELFGNYTTPNGVIEIINTAGTATVTTNSSGQFYNLILGGSSAFDLSQGGSGITVADSLTLKGSATISNGTSGLTTTITTALYYNSTGVTTLNGPLTVSGNTTLAAGTFNLSSSSPGTFSAGNLTIAGTFTDNGNAINITGNWALNTGGTYNGTGTVSFIGTANQTIGGTLVAGTSFYNLEINDNTLACTTTPFPFAVTLNSPVTVTSQLFLNNGVIGTTSSNLLTIGTSTTSATTDVGSTTSYVDGPIAVFGPNPVTFPVGNQGIYAQLYIEGSGSNTTSAFANGIDNGKPASEFQCQYTFSGSPGNNVSADMDVNGTAGSALSPVQDFNGEEINSTSKMEYWTLSLLSSAANNDSCFVLLNSNYPTTSGISTLSDLCVAHYDNTSPGSGLWENMGPDLGGSVGSTVSAESGIEFTDLSINPTISWGSKAGINPLPIQLTSFTAHCQNYYALLQWTTATETDNDYFTIERTQDGVNFTTIAVVKGAGTSSTAHSYSVIDEEPLNGISYYRISQTDLDGNTQHLNMTVFQPCEGSENVSAYAVNKHTIDVQINSTINDNYTYTLMNMLGQVISTQTVNVSVGLNDYKIDADVAGGIYILQVAGKEKVYSKKIILGTL
ncbi:MAG: T9SS type A sorting domain-containing protein, partial [Bacteroidia bacterium]